MHVPVEDSKLKKSSLGLGRLGSNPLRLGFAALLLLPLLVSLVHFVHSKHLFRGGLERIPALSSAYDPATVLNIEVYASRLQSPIPEIDTTTRAPPASFLALYRASPRQCKFRPHRLHLHQALEKLRSANGYPLPVSLHDPNTIHIQLVCASHSKKKSLEKSFLDESATLSRRFEQASIIPIRASDVSQSDCLEDVFALVAHLQHANRAIKRPSVLFAESVDHHLLLSASAAHLLLHRGPHSALSGLLSLGSVYTGKTMAPFASRDAFRWLLVHHQPLPVRPRAPQRAHLDAMGPVRPTCCDLRGFGIGDGEKIMCANAASFPARTEDSAPACWVLSLGCGGRFDFEEAIIARTHCKVHTFDCTKDFKVPRSVREHVTLHKKCVGQRGDDQLKGFLGWNEMLDLVRNVTPGLPRMPAVVKMDVEGWEVPLLDELVETGAQLPEQIAMEIHNGAGTKYGRSFPNKEDTRAWFAKMEEAGYRLVHRADNPYCQKCSEVTIVQAKALPAVL